MLRYHYTAGVELVEHGFVLPVLDAAAKVWYQHTDISHLRYFAGEVLEIAAPPFSTPFAAAMLRLLTAATARKGGRAGGGGLCHLSYELQVLALS